jgi:hypothetical protein
MATLLASPRSDSSRLQSISRPRRWRAVDLARRALQFIQHGVPLQALVLAQRPQRGELRQQVVVHDPFGARASRCTMASSSTRCRRSRPRCGPAS